MPPKFDILQSQANRKNCIARLIERIEELGRVIHQKDQRIIELQNFVGSIWTMAKGEADSSSLEQPRSLQINRIAHERVQSISFKEEQREKFAARSRSSSAEMSVPYSEGQLQPIHCLQLSAIGDFIDPPSEQQESREPTGKPDGPLLQNTLATTRVTQP